MKHFFFFINNRLGIWLEPFVFWEAFPLYLCPASPVQWVTNLHSWCIMLPLSSYFNLDGLQFKYLILQPFQTLQTHKTKELGWLPLGIQWPLHQISCKQKYYAFILMFFKMNKIHVFPIFFHFYVILLSMNVSRYNQELMQ